MTVLESLWNHGFTMGRMISGSKSGYRRANPNSVCHFNANIVTINDGKVWYGDLDLTKDAEALKLVAKETNTIIYVLREADGRFGEEGKPSVELIKRAVWNTTEETPFE